MDNKPIEVGAYDTDKAQHPHYLRSYEDYFKPLLDKEVKLLELGIYWGGSLLLWRDYFERGVIAGLDLNPVTLDDPSGRVRIYQGQQQDTALLDRIANETAPAGFDVIIDDCSHIGELTRISFWFDGARFRYEPKLQFNSRLFRIRSAIAHAQRSLPALTPLWRAAKRLMNRKQFRSHNSGLVGFVKELVDECGRADITREDLGPPPYRPSKFREMRISAGQVFIVKA